MLRKKEKKKKERVKDEAYYAMKIGELKDQTKGLSLMAKGRDESDGTY